MKSEGVAVQVEAVVPAGTPVPPSVAPPVPDSPLPQTGTDLDVYILAAVLLVLVGLALLRVGHRSTSLPARNTTSATLITSES